MKLFGTIGFFASTKCLYIERDDMIKLGFPKTGDLFCVEKTSSRFNVFRASLLYQEQNFPLIISLIDSLSAEYLALANFFLLIHR